MTSVSVTIALAQDPKIKCAVSINRDPKGIQTWRRFSWSVGGLKFGPVGSVKAELTSGKWKYDAPRKDLYLLNGLYIFGNATNVRADFLTSVTCGQSLVCTGEFWHDGSYRKTKWEFWYGCV